MLTTVYFATNRALEGPAADWTSYTANIVAPSDRRRRASIKSFRSRRRSEKRQRADFDALARPGMRRRVGIGEGGVRRPAGAPVAQ